MSVSYISFSSECLYANCARAGVGVDKTSCGNEGVLSQQKSYSFLQIELTEVRYYLHLLKRNDFFDEIARSGAQF